MTLPKLAWAFLATSIFASTPVNAALLDQFDLGSATSRVHASTLSKQQVNELAHQKQDPFLGNSRATISVVEFFDYRCGYCLAMQPRLARLLEKNPNVKIIVKILANQGDEAVTAGQAALVANMHGHFAAVNNTLIASHSAVEPDDISKLALSIGMSYQDFTREMASGPINQQMLATQNLADSLDLTGTPAFYVMKSASENNPSAYVIHGFVPEAALQAVINKL